MADLEERVTCPRCGHPMSASDNYLDRIMQRPGFFFCRTENCGQPTIEKAARARTQGNQNG